MSIAGGGWGLAGGEGGTGAMVFGCLPLAAPIGLSPLLILTLCGPERVLVVSTEPPDDLSCLTTPAAGGGGGRVEHPPNHPLGREGENGILLRASLAPTQTLAYKTYPGLGEGVGWSQPPPKHTTKISEIAPPRTHKHTPKISDAPPAEGVF